MKKITYQKILLNLLKDDIVTQLISYNELYSCAIEVNRFDVLKYLCDKHDMYHNSNMNNLILLKYDNYEDDDEYNNLRNLIKYKKFYLIKGNILKDQHEHLKLFRLSIQFGLYELSKFLYSKLVSEGFPVKNMIYCKRDYIG